MVKFNNLLQPNQEYVNARNALIPAAERLAQSYMKKNSQKRYSKEIHAYQFSKAMNELAVEAGLVNPRMIKLFDAKKLPFGESYGI